MTDLWVLLATNGFERETVVGSWDKLLPLYKQQAREFGVIEGFPPDPVYPIHLAQAGSLKVELLRVTRVLE